MIALLLEWEEGASINLVSLLDFCFLWLWIVSSCEVRCEEKDSAFLFYDEYYETYYRLSVLFRLGAFDVLDPFVPFT